MAGCGIQACRGGDEEKMRIETQRLFDWSDTEDHASSPVTPLHSSPSHQPASSSMAISPPLGVFHADFPSSGIPIIPAASSNQWGQLRLWNGIDASDVIGFVSPGESRSFCKSETLSIEGFLSLDRTTSRATRTSTDLPVLLTQKGTAPGLKDLRTTNIQRLDWTTKTRRTVGPVLTMFP